MDPALRDYLSAFRGRTIHYVPNPGNAGDSVMASAIYQAFEACGLDVATVNPSRFDPRGKTVMYGGGGNLYEPGRYSHRVLKAIHRDCAHLTILPHTIKDVDDLLGELGPNVTAICRERPSFAYVSGFAGRRYDALLMHDLAFSLDVGRVMAGGRYNTLEGVLRWVAKRVLPDRVVAPSLENVRRALRPPAVPAEVAARRGGAVDVFRTDGESRGAPLPPGNVDASLVFMYGVAPRAVADHSTRSLMGFLDRFDTIRTDRLHVGISAALLGKRVELHANNYYKIRAIHEFSLADRYPNVVWMR